MNIPEINNNALVIIISDETEAIQNAIDNAIKGEFIFVSADDIQNTLSYVEQQLNTDKSSAGLKPVALNQMQS